MNSSWAAETGGNRRRGRLQPLAAAGDMRVVDLHRHHLQLQQ